MNFRFALSEEARRAFLRALEAADEYGSDDLKVDHLVLGICDQPLVNRAGTLLERAGFRTNQVKSELTKRMTPGTRSGYSRGLSSNLRTILDKAEVNGRDVGLITTDGLLSAVIMEGQSVAGQVLLELDITIHTLIMHYVTFVQEPEEIPGILLHNLRALVLGENIYYPEVLPLPDGLEIGLISQTWTQMDGRKMDTPNPIGKEQEIILHQSGVVACVFDHTNNEHITRLVRKWHERMTPMRD